MYGLIGRVCTPKKQNLHVDTKREVNTSIKGKESQGGVGARKEEKILPKGEWEGDDAPRRQSKDLNPPNCIDVRLSYSSQAYLRMSFHKHHDQIAHL